MWFEGGESLVQLNRDLKTVGRVPRLLSACLLVVAAVIAWAGGVASGSYALVALVLAAPLTIFILSLPVGAHAKPTELVVRSYLKTYVVRFEEVLSFDGAAYSGLWNRSAGTDSWLNLGMRMIDVILQDGSGVSLRATICRRRTCDLIVARLNARLMESER